MQRAKEKSTSSVLLASATFEHDEDAVPSDFIRLPSLKRSTASEYPSLNPPKQLPFIQDIFDSLRNSQVEFEYVVYTTSDIIVHEDFYDIVQEQIDKNGLDAFTISRQIIPEKTNDGRFYTVADLDEVFGLTGKKHPGFDCFVMKKSVFEMLEMGDVF